MAIDNSDYNIIIPFGPSIYEAELTTEQLAWIQDYAEKSSSGKLIDNNNLVGNMEKQLEIPYDESQSNYFMDLLTPHVKNYMKSDYARIYDLTKNRGALDLPNEPDWETLSYNIGRGPWLNYMRANEFTPVHKHAGVISGIIMVSVPEEISKESETYPIKTNIRCPGQLEWIHGEWGSGSFKVVPVTGKFYLFPNALRHQVYPFKSDVERITMSWNIFNPTFAE